MDKFRKPFSATTADGSNDIRGQIQIFANSLWRLIEITGKPK